MLPEGPARLRDLHVFGQSDDYKLGGGGICHHKRAHGGPDCSPSTEYLCFLSTRDGPEGPSEVVPHTDDSIRPPFPQEKTSKTRVACF